MSRLRWFAARVFAGRRAEYPPAPRPGFLQVWIAREVGRLRGELAAQRGES